MACWRSIGAAAGSISATKTSAASPATIDIGAVAPCRGTVRFTLMALIDPIVDWSCIADIGCIPLA